jgi:hypothetical protein
MSNTLGPFGHHPEAEIDFSIEADNLTGMAYDVRVGLADSQWPFWGRLSRALRLGRENRWYGQPSLQPYLRGLEPYAQGKDVPDPWLIPGTNNNV